VPLTGEFRHTIDAKGRLIVPARLRDELGEKVFLSTWLEDCISMWSEALFEQKVSAPLVAERSGNASKRALARILGSATHTDGVDAQGRITVPPSLREHARIDRDVVIIGALDHAEIWSPEGWQREKERFAEGGLEDLAEQLNF